MGIRFRITVLIILFLPSFLYGKEKTFGVMTHIEDAFTHERVKGEVAIKLNDSIIRKLKTFDFGESYLPLNGVPGTRYVCVASLEGYEPDSAAFVIPNSRLERINHVFALHKKRQESLNEVTVTATAIKMVMKGDTLIYNANAFELASGSMLDALVAQLPGVELKDGVIRVNGQYVSSLLLNGEDFFKGDPGVALRNLPAFMIKNVKVYNKESDHAYITGKETMADKPLVMDVNLKREYATGWIANVEGGYGLPGNRYQGRGFGLVFSDNVRTTLFVNANNINDVSTVGTDGTWGASHSLPGDNTLLSGGVEYLFHNKSKPVKINGTVTLTRDIQELLTETSQRLLFESGDVWKRQRETQTRRRFGIDTRHTLNIQKPSFYTTLTPYFSYRRGTLDLKQNSATFSNDPADEYRLASLDAIIAGTASDLLKSEINYLYDRYEKNAEGTLSAGFDSQTFVAIPDTPDALWIELSGNYARLWHDNDLSYIMKYADGNGDKARQQKNPFSSPSGNIGTSVCYRLDFPEGTRSGRASLLFTAKYAFRHNRQKTEWFNLLDMASNQARAMMELDPANSYRRSESVHSPAGKVEFEYKLTRRNATAMTNTTYQFKASVEDRGELASLTNRAAETEKVARNSNFISPAVSFNCSHQTGQSLSMFSSSYGWSQYESPLSYLLNYQYNSDPLNIFLPNADLSRTGTHLATLSYNMRQNASKRQLGVTLTWRMQENALVNGRFYDRTTGVSTWKPMNINGNWNARAEVNYSQPLDPKRMFELSTTTGYIFDNNVDFSSTSDVPVRSSVRNNTVVERLRISWQHRGYSVTASLNAQWHNAASAMAGFNTLNLWDIQPGLSAIIPLPGKIQLSTDVTATIRRGYSDASINRTYVLWNASLSRGFFNDKLTLKLRGYDILGQVQPFTSIINAQAITETYRTTLSRYVMLTIAYRLNIQPKKK